MNNTVNTTRKLENSDEMEQHIQYKYKYKHLYLMQTTL
jgi:hypothetical protein